MQKITHCVANKQCNTSQQYVDHSNFISIDLPSLKAKSQLNKIIVCTNGKPDYLAINIYWDTFRSWYNPSKIYTKEGNVLSIKKLKTNGIYTNYQKLSDIHGVSKETIRKKLVKLEKLGLINKSFQHKEDVCTKSFNRLIIYVWKDTPFFLNSYGVDQKETANLNPQTNYKYIEEKHNIVFNAQVLQNKDNSKVSPEWHFKKRLAARLPQKPAYELLKAFDVIDIKEGILNLYLSKYVDLTDQDQKLILQEAQSIYEKLDFTDERLGYIQDIKIIMPEKITTTKHINQNKTQELSLPTGIWGRVRQSLIVTYGEAIDRNWFLN
ncbi:unnamed protein product [Rotaria magnacalcarata]|uniref:Uncharacterized protein n=1 Tax=Rotaria magnacalcarata TaxID=392030 RepID=A0A816ZTM0_9BILA|nr:unnamed protein product [Rotaria magnacalcarata]